MNFASKSIKKNVKHQLNEVTKPLIKDSALDAEIFSKAKVIRAIESLSQRESEISPLNVAMELGIPRTLLYQDQDILQKIYEATAEKDQALQGADALIQKLIKDLEKQERKIKRLKKDLEVAKKEQEQIYNDAFVKGASMSYSTSSGAEINSYMEKWARGVLFIDQDAELDEQQIKKSYRKLITVVHPDQSAQDTGPLVSSLNKAYKFLLELHK